jgi:hypothetical protein
LAGIPLLSGVQDVVLSLLIVTVPRLPASESVIVAVVSALLKSNGTGGLLKLPLMLGTEAVAMFVPLPGLVLNVHV